jgi:hypothetical protein
MGSSDHQARPQERGVTVWQLAVGALISGAFAITAWVWKLAVGALISGAFAITAWWHRRQRRKAELIAKGLRDQLVQAAATTAVAAEEKADWAFRAGERLGYIGVTENLLVEAVRELEKHDPDAARRFAGELLRRELSPGDNSNNTGASEAGPTDTAGAPPRGTIYRGE